MLQFKLHGISPTIYANRFGRGFCNLGNVEVRLHGGFAVDTLSVNTTWLSSMPYADSQTHTQPIHLARAVGPWQLATLQVVQHHASSGLPIPHMR